MPFCHNYIYVGPGTKQGSDHHDLPPQLGDNPAYGIFAGQRTSTTIPTTHQTSSTRQEVMEEGLTVPSSNINGSDCEKYDNIYDSLDF